MPQKRGILILNIIRNMIGEGTICHIELSLGKRLLKNGD
jgi:hypothetical protein